MIKTYSLLAIVVHVSMIITGVLTELDSDVEPNGMKDKDSMSVMAHIDMKISDFDDLAAAIAYLKNKITRHSDTHLVDPKELTKDKKFLDDLSDNAVQPIHEELGALRFQLRKFNESFDNATLAEVNGIVSRAENILTKGYDSLRHAQTLEQKWKEEEERRIIQEKFSGKLKAEPQAPSNVSGQLIQKLSMLGDFRLPKSYPVKMSGGPLLYMNDGDKYMYQQIKQVKKSERKDKAKSKVIASDKDEIANANPAEIVSFLQHAKEELDTEALHDIIESSGATIRHYYFEAGHYSNEARKALEDSKEASRKFIENRFHFSDVETREHGGYFHFVFTIVLVMFVLVGLMGLLYSLGLVAEARRSRRLLQSFPGLELRGVGGGKAGPRPGGSGWRRWSPQYTGKEN